MVSSFVTHYSLLIGFLLLNTLTLYIYTLSLLHLVPSSDLSIWPTPTHPSKYRSSFLEEGDYT